MRRIPALLCMAGLATAPASAIAGPSNDPWSSPHSQRVERFEWSSAKGRLGVMVLSLTPELRKHFGAAEDRGVIVAHVEPNTPAAAAGIKVGDVIVEVHGHKIDAAPAVLTALSGVGKGEHARIAIVRDRKTLALDATLSDNASSTMMSLPWLREWMTPFDANRPLSSPFDGSWFREWMKFDPQTEASTWFDKLHELFAPKNTQS